MGLDEGQQPGAELLAAVEAAEEAELEVALIDRGHSNHATSGMEENEIL